MFKIQGNLITLTHGDTLNAIVVIKDADGTDYEPETGDALRFAMKEKSRESETLLILKEIPIDTMVLHLDPEDTKSLPNRRKTYDYDIEITHATGDIDTFISGKITIIEEVC